MNDIDEKVSLNENEYFVDFSDIITNKNQPQTIGINTKLHEFSILVKLLYQEGVPIRVLENKLIAIFEEFKEKE